MLHRLSVLNILSYQLSLNSFNVIGKTLFKLIKQTRKVAENFSK